MLGKVSAPGGITHRRPCVVMGRFGRSSPGPGQVRTFGTKGAGSQGAGLARFPTGQGRAAVEVSRPDRSVRLPQGEGRPAAAQAGARAVPSGVADSAPGPGEGEFEMIRKPKERPRPPTDSGSQHPRTWPTAAHASRSGHGRLQTATHRLPGTEDRPVASRSGWLLSLPSASCTSYRRIPATGARNPAGHSSVPETTGPQ